MTTTDPRFTLRHASMKVDGRTNSKLTLELSYVGDGPDLVQTLGRRMPAISLRFVGRRGVVPTFVPHHR